MIDENKFFRNVTLRICGSLALEEGLHSCIEYISQHMPASALYLERHERDLGAMRIVARADVKGGSRIDKLVPYTEEAKAAMAQLGHERRADGLPRVLVFNRPQDEPITRCLLEGLGEPISSVMSLPLIVEGQIGGALALIAEGNDRFDEQHAQLYATLKEPFFVAMANTLQHEEVVRLKDRLADDNRYLHRELLRISGDEIVGADFGLKGVMRMVRQVAPTESPVLLTGETGVGKDVVANAIHLASPRRDGPLVTVNCGAIPDALLDSELFGHERGAFTGALSRKRGRFERAHHGTIFLDEIGEMPLNAQVRLLRVLQHREIERVGGTERIPVDIRILAATNKDLQAAVQSGRFREDLWFRINVFSITIPSLRQRTGDIPALVQHFIERKSKELKLATTPTLADGAIGQLLAYGWPGNVRELENLVERAMILHRGEPLSFDLARTRSPGPTAGPSRTEDEDLLALDVVIAHHIRRALSSARGKIHGAGGAAELLGLNPNTLRSRMRKLGIPFRRQRT